MKSYFVAVLFFVFFLSPFLSHAGESGIAPSFALKNLSSQEVKLADFQGKVVLMSFWATWCKPCLAEMPEMVGLHGKYKARGFTVLGVNEDEEDKLDAVKKVVSVKKVTYPILLDPEHSVQGAYGVEGLPCLILVDHHGMIQFSKTGYKKGGLAWLEAEIQTALAGREVKPTLSVGVVLASGGSAVFKERVRVALAEQVKGVQGYALVPADNADYDLVSSVARVGKTVGVEISLVDGHNRNVIKKASDSGSESEIEAMVGRIVKQLGIQ
jgi:peroxiredoxin